MKNLITFKLTSLICRKVIVLVKDLEVVVVYFRSDRGILLLKFMKKIRTHSQNQILVLKESSVLLV